MPKLKDEFERNLYSALEQLGFTVSVAKESLEVTDADLEITEGKAIRLSGLDDQPSSDEVKFVAMIGDPKDPNGGDDLKHTNLVFSKADTSAAMVVKIRKVMEELAPGVAPSVPEAPQDVPSMNDKELAKKRDSLLDKLNALPEGDPKREQVKEQLKSLKAGLHRVSFDIEVPAGSQVSLQQYIEALQQVHIQLAGSLTSTPIGVNHVRDPLPQVTVGERVLIATNIDLVDSVYFSEGFHCGYHIPEEAVDLGKYKIAVKQGAYATVNSISGSKINLIEVSELGVISAYDPIKGKEISNQVQVHSCTVDLQNLKKVADEAPGPQPGELYVDWNDTEPEFVWIRKTTPEVVEFDVLGYASFNDRWVSSITAIERNDPEYGTEDYDQWRGKLTRIRPSLSMQEWVQARKKAENCKDFDLGHSGESAEEFLQYLLQ